MGSFCGVNKGKVEELTTIGGSVSGNQDVGGIVGKVKPRRRRITRKFRADLSEPA